MTLGFALFTIGAAFIYTALQNKSVADVLLGREGPGQPGDIAQFSQTASVGGTTDKGGATDATSGKKVPGLGNWRGTPVCKWILPILHQAVKDGWDGELSDGYRSKAQQAAACANTSGPCATPGESNHQGKRFPSCAIDVRNPASFEAAMKKQHYPLKAGVAGDPVHYSRSGN